ncbi:hypothetical protein PoB_002300100 [Plakobranchus ocellatus]|uniref:Uncharacterized protein n=1 Tax=Plakobranchus ocellatus TaxID=259542 RepID=A0AAV3ZKN7_9GAST|nr:hypothetical protein PoB_002300100 [Plakobranchus ocellatus]
MVISGFQTIVSSNRPPVSVKYKSRLGKKNCDIGLNIKLKEGLQFGPGSRRMYGTILVLLKLLLAMTTAQEPSMKIVTSSSSFSCSKDFLVLGEDFVTFELDVSGNNSEYTLHDYTYAPRFILSRLVRENGKTRAYEDTICWPFGEDQNHFCEKTNVSGKSPGCSCESVGAQVYRVKTVHIIKKHLEIKSSIRLVWISNTGGTITKDYYLPKVRAEPNIKNVQITPSFSCTFEYQIQDYTILRLDLSGNSSRYSFKKDVWPRFEYRARKNGKLNKAMLFCTPFTIPQNGFCVRKDFFPNGCSCEHVGKDTFRLRANLTIWGEEMSVGVISLAWPGPKTTVRYDYDLSKFETTPGNANFNVCVNQRHVLLSAPLAMHTMFLVTSLTSQANTPRSDHDHHHCQP